MQFPSLVGVSFWSKRPDSRLPGLNPKTERRFFLSQQMETKSDDQFMTLSRLRADGAIGPLLSHT